MLKPPVHLTGQVEDFLHPGFATRARLKKGVAMFSMDNPSALPLPRQEGDIFMAMSG